MLSDGGHCRGQIDACPLWTGDDPQRTGGNPEEATNLGPQVLASAGLPVETAIQLAERPVRMMVGHPPPVGGQVEGGPDGIYRPTQVQHFADLWSGRTAVFAAEVGAAVPMSGIGPETRTAFVHKAE
ncbi:hypothetical protein M0R72_08930 [Candidatus Pacearchaeota archaeon]|nr:hypothetical protein [Candidatus Pacearchaeota archaeon]